VNILDFIGRFLLSIALACVVSIMCSMGITALLFNIVHAFELNYNRDAYWVFNVSIISLIVSWIISFGCFMSIIK
jgi:putative effector of murein hydrolase LrgA (UPF0299 family)